MSNTPALGILVGLANAPSVSSTTLKSVDSTAKFHTQAGRLFAVSSRGIN